MEEFGPKILRAIEERFGGRRPRTPEPRSKEDHSATPRAIQIASEQGGEEWRVVEPRKRRRTDKKKPEKTGAPEMTKKRATTATLTRAAGAPRSSTAMAATKKTPAQVPKTTALPRTPRTSAVTVTLNGGANMSYADVRNGERKDPAHGNRCGVRRDAESYDGRHNYKGPCGQGQRERLVASNTFDRGAGYDRGGSRGPDKNGGATSGRDRHLGEQERAAASTGLGGGMQQRGGAGWGNRHIQRRSRVCMD
jgi:hypothetical protein